LNAIESRGQDASKGKIRVGGRIDAADFGAGALPRVAGMRIIEERLASLQQT
jgi:hypothetical protein